MSVAQIQISQPYFIETTTPLAINDIFVGVARDMGQPGNEATHVRYRTFVVIFFASHASANNGAKIEISNNAVTWHDAAVATLTANVSQVLSVPVVARFYRVRLVNGPTAQTACIINSSVSQT